MSHPLSDLREQHDGKFPAYAWPGGYPILYLMDDGGCLCPACANGENDSDATTNESERGTGWLLLDYFIHWEGEAEICSHCNTEIESAYGVPE